MGKRRIPVKGEPEQGLPWREDRAGGWEYALYGFVPIFFLLIYFLASFVLNETVPERYLFGFSQCRHLGISGFLLLTAATMFAFFRPSSFAEKWSAFYTKYERLLFSRKLYLLFFASFCVIPFFLLRSNFLNPDALGFRRWFESYIPVYGAFVTLDEMWEFYIHSQFWYYAHAWFGTSISSSYQILSSCSGGVFVLLLLLYARDVCPAKPLSFFLMIVSGGTMQLFFGDIENYTMTAVIIMAYFVFSHLFLQRRCSLLFPSLALTMAVTFHLLAGFLMPSLLYLYFVALKRRDYLSILMASCCSVAFFAATLAFFHFTYRPLREFVAMSHVFGYWGPLSKKIVKPTFSYYGQLINLQMLLFPISLFGIFLILFRRVRVDLFNTHLLISCVSMLVFFYFFRSAIGVYNDWNLFANVGIPVSIFSAYNLLRYECAKEQRTSWGVTLFLFGMNSYCWIVSNHWFA